MNPQLSKGSVVPKPPSVSQGRPTKGSHRTLSGSDIIKSFIHESNERKELSRLNRSLSREVKPKKLTGRDTTNETIGPRIELESKAATNCLNDKISESLAAEVTTTRPLSGFFQDRKISRRLSSSTKDQESHRIVPGMETTPVINMVPKKKLVMDQREGKSVLQFGTHYRHNLAAKLDALSRSSIWMRRKNLLKDGKVVRRFTERFQQRLAAAAENNEHYKGVLLFGTEVDAQIIAAFRRIVHLWRERKRKREEEAMKIVQSKTNITFRKEATVYSANVVGILSRRVVREVPALKFFDEEGESLPPTSVPSPTTPNPIPSPSELDDITPPTTPNPSSSPSQLDGITPSMSGEAKTVEHQTPSTIICAVPERVAPPPQGVCYSMDEAGFRRIKMHSTTVRLNRKNHDDRKKENITVEKAVGRSIYRKMIKRVIKKREMIHNLSQRFHSKQDELNNKLQSDLTLRYAQAEKMYEKRAGVLMNVNTTLPSYETHKELNLARVQMKRAHLTEKCLTLCVFGDLLKFVENRSEANEEEVSEREIYFLELFRHIVEKDQVLTEILVQEFQQELRKEDLKNPTIMEMLKIVKSGILKT